MDLSTSYMGLELRNPIVPSASPLSRDLDTIKEMEDAGAAAIVMYSLFEEQIAHEQRELDYFLTQGADSYQEALSYFPVMDGVDAGPERYLEHIRRAREATDIPIIGSLNGVSEGGWLDYATSIEQAGASAIELNVYYVATDPMYSATDIEHMYLNDLIRVKEAVRIPVAMKLSPYFSSFANFARAVDEAGADALVLFNRFYQPDFNLDALEVVPSVNLSVPHEGRLPLRWIAILYGQVRASLAATTGVHSATDVIKMLMAGADVTMMCSALLHHGPKHIERVLYELTQWLDENEYESVRQMKGSMSQRHVKEPAAFERANYMKTLNSWKVLV